MSHAKEFLYGVIALTVIGFVLGMGISSLFHLSGKHLVLVPNDMALCPQWIEESRAADQAGVWAVDVDGESAR